MNQEFVRVEVTPIEEKEVQKWMEILRKPSSSRKMLYSPDKKYIINVTPIGESADTITLGLIDQMIHHSGIVKVLGKFCEQFVTDAIERGEPEFVSVATIYLFEIGGRKIKLVRRIKLTTERWIKVERM
ncbi:MAG: hypothetical protein NTW32_27070 [Chloroflexi bacterium]|nr:hypothetical protein [Chloroflexota bacterium]